MEIYSFYLVEKERKITERLRDHVLLSLEVIENEGRLLRFGKSLNENFPRVLKYSVIFHDFGKIFHNKYDFKENRSLSFDGHEVISCWGANEYLKRQEDISGIERKIIILSILLHHHPMNVSEKFERLKKRSEKIDGTFFDLFYEELDQIIERKEIRVSKDVSELSEEVNWSLLKNSWRDVWMNSNSNIRKTLLLTVQALVAADYYSANKKRGGSGHAFSNVINTFIEFYMPPIQKQTFLGNQNYKILSDRT